jgi:hypothetical protein
VDDIARIEHTAAMDEQEHWLQLRGGLAPHVQMQAIFTLRVPQLLGESLDDIGCLGSEAWESGSLSDVGRAVSKSR